MLVPFDGTCLLLRVAGARYYCCPYARHPSLPRRCAESLWKHASRPPLRIKYVNRETDEEEQLEQPRIMACCWGPGSGPGGRGAGGATTVLVMLDGQGNLVDLLQCGQLSGAIPRSFRPAEGEGPGGARGGAADLPAAFTDARKAKDAERIKYVKRIVVHCTAAYRNVAWCGLSVFPLGGQSVTVACSVAQRSVHRVVSHAQHILCGLACPCTYRGAYIRHNMAYVAQRGLSGILWLLRWRELLLPVEATAFPCRWRNYVPVPLRCCAAAAAAASGPRSLSRPPT